MIGLATSIGRGLRGIRQQLQPQPDPHLLPRYPLLVLARGAVGAGLVAKNNISIT